MNTKRFSIIVAAGALASMLLATGASASGPRLEPNEPSDGLASYQIIKKELMIQHTANVVLDFETMLFLEINTFGHGQVSADLPQADTADAIVAYTSPCRGEGLTDAVNAQNGVIGLILTYCSHRAEFLDVQAPDVAGAIPLHPDWIDGGLYDTPTMPTPRAAPVTDWPIGYTDY